MPILQATVPGAAQGPVFCDAPGARLVRPSVPRREVQARPTGSA